MRVRKLFAARRIRDHSHVLHKLLVIKKVEQRCELAGLLVDHNQGKDAAVRVAIARRPAPGRVGALQHVHYARKRRIRGERIPITQRLQATVELILQIMRHAGQRVALFDTHRIGDVFVTAGEGNRLKGDRLNLINVLRGKLNNLPNAIVIDRVYDGGDECDLDTDTRQIFNRAQLNIEQVADAAVFILFFADAIELQINTMLARSLGGFTKLDVLGKANSIRRCQDAIETNLSGVSNCFQIVR